jgi:hypothetical protein
MGSEVKYEVQSVSGRVRVLANTESAQGCSNWRLLPISAAGVADLEAQALQDLGTAFQQPGEAQALSLRVRRSIL